MLRLYDNLDSGNGYKVRLLLHQLGMPFKRIDVDVFKGETRTPDFLAKNRNGRIPLLEFDDGSLLPESNAIMFYLAEDTPFLPGDRRGRAEVLRWMFFEQYSHEPYIAVLRFWNHAGLAEEKRDQIPEKRKHGLSALEVMADHLAERDYFVGGAYSIADIALYAYTHVADEGGFDLAGYPAILAWLDRVRGQPDHIPITEG